MTTATISSRSRSAGRAPARRARTKGASRSPRCAKSSPPAWHAGFLKLLPQIQEHAGFCFRGYRRELRDELIQETIANALVAYVRLAELDKEDLAYATPLTRYAVVQVCAGRRVGSRQNVRDVLSELCQKEKRIVVERLDRFDVDAEEWQEVLVEDRRSGPAEIAATRIDFHAWLASLPRRKRRIAQRLARGESTSRVARLFQLSAVRISQLRAELKAAWEEFQGELNPAATA
jgi:hypothetical protein